MRTIDQHRHIGGMAEPDDVLDGQHQPAGRSDVIDDGDAGALGDRPLDALQDRRGFGPWKGNLGDQPAFTPPCLAT